MAGSIHAEFSLPVTPQGVSLRQEPLAFAFEALEPYLNAGMMRRHYQKHAAHVQKLRKTLEAEQMTVGNVVSLMPRMERVVQPPRTDSRMPIGRLSNSGLSFQAPQTLSGKTVQMLRHAGGGHINHTAFWRFLAPPGSGPKGPKGEVRRAIKEDFGSEKSFRNVFKEVAMKRNGPGWAWLVYRQDGCLIASSTANEDNPLMSEIVPWQNSGRPILALDLWEHSYQEQFKDDREQYIDAWWNVVNWDHVARAYGLVRNKALASF